MALVSEAQRMDFTVGQNPHSDLGQAMKQGTQLCEPQPVACSLDEN